MIILVTLALFAFLAITALAIDGSHLLAVRNELQNAADAGALAGARYLYNDFGTSVNTGANQIAYDAATSNKAMAAAGVIAVDVEWPSGTDVQRGHWSFGVGTLPRGFYPNEPITDPPDLWNASTAELDSDTNFINAVKVVTRRRENPAASFFARIFRWDSFELSAEAVAYIGFAGSLAPDEVDQPIAICKQSILADGVYQCNIGRMLNSGNNSATSNTGSWTNFTQDPCKTSNPANMSDDICRSGNDQTILFGVGIGTVNGVQDTIFQDLETCFHELNDTNEDGIADEAWELTLPVIDCPANAVSNCATLVGAVKLKIIWVQRDNPNYTETPFEMSDPDSNIYWPSAEDLSLNVEDLETYFVGINNGDVFPSFPAGTTVNSVFYNKADRDSGKVRWASFVKRFNLRNVGTVDEAPYATFTKKSIYFLPSCEYHEPKGKTGGENFGILAKVPVLVQ